MKACSKRSGKLITHSNKYEYFVPTSLYDIKIELDNELTILLVEAAKHLGALENATSNLSFTNTIIAKYVEKEALLSAQIEGTQASLHDVYEANSDPKKARRGVEDVINYVKALNQAIRLLDTLPISTRFFNTIHATLLQNARGQNKHPGELRKSQNWIGGGNLSIKDAWYIPPAVEDMHICLSNLEKYINDNIEIEPLIKIALIHYQFESIHPYLDGNGRLGRLLISLLLKTNGYLTNPILYLSLYLKQNRSEYYELLSNVRIKGQYERWIKFFLKGIADTSKKVLKAINEINNLKDNWTKKIIKLNKNNERQLLNMLNFVFEMPYFNANDIINNLKVSRVTANRNIKTFLDLNIIQYQEQNKEKFNTYKVTKYLDILEKGTELLTISHD